MELEIHLDINSNFFLPKVFIIQNEMFELEDYKQAFETNKLGVATELLKQIGSVNINNFIIIGKNDI